MRGKDYGLSENDHIFSDLNNTDRSALRQKHLRPYLRLMTGFMLISLMMQPISYYLSNEDIVTQAISTAVKGENNPAFLDGAKEEKQNQIKEQITTLFSQYDLKVLDVDSKVNEKEPLEDRQSNRQASSYKETKTAISNFYNNEGI